MSPLVIAALGFVVGWATSGRGEKTMDLRIFDVVALGPWLVTLAHPHRHISDVERNLLAFSGGATIGYNLHNMVVASPMQKA